MNIANEIAIALTKKIERDLLGLINSGPIEYGCAGASSEAPRHQPSFYEIRETIYRTLQPYFREATFNAYVSPCDFRMEQPERYKKAIADLAHEKLVKLASEYVVKREWDSYVNEGVVFSLVIVDTKEVLKHKEQK